MTQEPLTAQEYFERAWNAEKGATSMTTTDEATAELRAN